MSDLPDEFVPDATVVIEDAPVCPGCGAELGQAAREYVGIEYRGDTWCRACAYADSDAVVKADADLKCPSCYAATPFRRRKDPDEAVCHGCGSKFSTGVAAEFLGGDSA